MGGLVDPHYFWERSYRYRLSPRSASGYERCPCGRHLAVGIPCFVFEEIPYSLRGWLGREEFCSVRCARLYLLELKETLEASAAPSVLSDFEEVNRAVSALFVLTENEGRAQASTAAVLRR